MPPSFRLPASIIRRILAGVLLATLASVFVVVPANAQDDSEAPGEEGTVVADEVGTEPETGIGEPGGEQEQEPATEPPEPIVRELVADSDRTVQIVEYEVSGFPWVDVVIAVPPALAGELSSRSFSLTENGAVRSLDVAKLQDVLEVVVVIDTSGSMFGQPIESATAAAKEFIRSLDEDTRTAIIGFGATAQTKAGFDSTRAELDAAIDGLVANGETSLYDALVLASEQFGDSGARRFVVVLSDGRDTSSAASVEEAGSALASADVNLYAITLESADADFSGLMALTEQANGILVEATDSASLADTYAAVASRLTNQYLLTYRSATSGTASVAIAVDANGAIAFTAEEFDLGAGAALPSAADTPDSSTASAAEVIDTGTPDVSLGTTRNGFLGSADAIFLGGGAVFLGIVLVLFLVLSAEKSGPSARERLNFKRPVQRGGLASIADRASGIAERILEKQEKRGALDAALEKAGVDMRPGEYLIASAGVSLGVAAFGFIMFGPVAAAVFLVGGMVGGRVYINMKAGKRQKLFGNQLGDTLMMIAGSLRAGHGVVEAIDTVASQADSPTGDEFTRAVAEARIGRDMVESLYDIASRTGSEDFIWVVRAISINRELGGDLAEILDNVGETIRDRNRLRDQVKALSAEGKVSALILFALPIGVGGFVRLTNPEYLASMTEETAGKVMLVTAFLALTGGGIWLRKLVNVEF